MQQQEATAVEATEPQPAWPGAEARAAPLAQRRRVLPPPSQQLLQGSPEQPFVVRFNLTFAKVDELLDYIAVAFNLKGYMRFRPFLYPAAHAWLALHMALPLANICWRRRCMAARPADGGSWARWREVGAAAVRAAAMAGGVPYRLVLAALGAKSSAALVPPVDWTGGGALGAAVYVVNISAAPVLFLLWFKPLRFGWALPLQLAAMLADCTRFAGAVCRHPVMAQAELRAVQHAAAESLNLAALPLHPMLALHATSTSREHAAECTSVLIFLQLAAFALPAIHKARQEQRLFALHQRQRAQRGLPPEGGFHARVYAALPAPPRPGNSEALWALPLLILLWCIALTLQQFV